MSINPIFADSIDLPIVLVFGVIVLLPLLLFEVCVEALILKKVWQIPFRSLCPLTLIANCLSLLAGIPVKILNACVTYFLLPGDLPGYFALYPLAAAAGTLIYFVTTVGVEGGYAFLWLSRKGYKIAPRRIWMGMFLANLASYAVVAPLNYLVTRPQTKHVKEYTENANWTSHPGTKLLFVGGTNGNLLSMQLGSAKTETIVPKTVTDTYLISADLGLCLFRSTNNDIYLYRRTPPQCKYVMESNYHFEVDRAAFSPSGRYVVYAEENTLILWDLETGQQIDQPLIQQMPWEGSAAWSTNESTLYIGLGGGQIIQCTIQQSGSPSAETITQTNLAATNTPSLLTCYEQLRDGGYAVMPNDGMDGGANFYNLDTSGDLVVETESGIGSYLEIYSATNRQNRVESLSVDPGLLHFAQFDFENVAFLDRNECLFEASGYIYLLDIRNRRVGTVAKGGNFILLTPRYQKPLLPLPSF